jgi:hypothetical protein
VIPESDFAFCLQAVTVRINPIVKMARLVFIGFGELKDSLEF